MRRSRSIYHSAIRRHGRILGPTVGALEAMHRMDNPPLTVPTVQPDVCDHSLTYCPNLGQGDTTRFCEYCGIEFDGYDTVKGAGYATMPMLTPERLQELHNLRTLVRNIHREFDGVQWSADTLDVVADYLRRAGFEIHEPIETE